MKYNTVVAFSNSSNLICRVIMRCAAALIFGVVFVGSHALAEDISSTSALVTYDLGNDIFSPVVGTSGMVASDNKLASLAGLDVLRRGGNAVDAAVTVAFMLAVVLPNGGGLGGGGFMVLHKRETGENIALDFRETAPASARPEMFLDSNGLTVPERSRFSHLAVGVPGTVKGLTYALSQFGTMQLKETMAPAIALAKNGFEVGPELARLIEVEEERLGRWAASRRIFFKDGRPIREGEQLVQTDLADTLAAIASGGSDVFYNGRISRLIADEMAQHGGLITADDLRRYRVAERKPIIGFYRGYQVIGMPPPSAGGVMIMQILTMLEHFNLRRYGQGSAESIHLTAEAMKLAFADRATYLGDPDFINVPVARLLTARYLAARARSIKTRHVRPTPLVKAGRFMSNEGSQTTHLSVVDKWRNAVSMTISLNLNFGSGIVAGTMGILLNNQMDDFSSSPGVPNAFGLTGGAANAIQPLKRPLSSMSPTIVLRNGAVFLVTGSPGGSRIITTTVQTLLNVMEYSMNVAEAASVPRFHHQLVPDELRVEKGFSPDTLRLLRRMGYTLMKGRTMGRTESIAVQNDRLLGYSDPRYPESLTVGYK